VAVAMIAVGVHRMVRAAGHVGEGAEVIVERMVLLHYHDDVLEVLQGSVVARPVVGVRQACEGRVRQGQARSQREPAGYELQESPWVSRKQWKRTRDQRPPRGSLSRRPRPTIATLANGSMTARLELRRCRQTIAVRPPVPARRRNRSESRGRVS